MFKLVYIEHIKHMYAVIDQTNYNITHLFVIWLYVGFLVPEATMFGKK